MNRLLTYALVGTGIVAVGTFVCYGTTLGSYLRTGARQAGTSLQESVPTSFEIERVQTLIDDCTQVIADSQARLVKQRVDLDYLEQDVVRGRARVQDLTREVEAARTVLAVERPSYRIGESEYPRQHVVAEARLKAEGLVRARDVAQAKQETLVQLRQALSQAEAQLDSAKRTREQHQLRLAELRAKAETVAIRRELVTTLDNLPRGLERGAFQEVETAFARVERQLEVQRRMLDDQAQQAAGRATLSFAAPAQEDVMASLDRALAPPAAAAQAASAEAERPAPAPTTALVSDRR